MLIVFGGLPGTGKTTLARELGRRLSALYLRIDTLEQAILHSAVVSNPGPAGYFVGYAVAADNLALGRTVVADSVNALAITRDAWLEVANNAHVPCLEIEIICSDTVEHRRRAETRKPDIAGHRPPDWQEILNRHYEPWQREHIVIDTAALSIPQAIAIEAVIHRLPQSRSLEFNLFHGRQ
jgi:predicted kinase